MLYPRAIRSRRIRADSGSTGALDRLATALPCRGLDVDASNSCDVIRCYPIG
jgi:hypothetical protein